MLAHSHQELKDAPYVVFVDSTRRYVDCSDAVCELLGYSREQLFAKRIEDISYDINEVPKLFSQYLQSGTLEGEYVLQRQDHTPLPIRYKAFVFSDGCCAAIWEPVGGWKELYLAALVEIDPAKQKQKIELAVNSIRQIADGHGDEHRQMHDALAMLNALRKMAK